MIDTIVCIFRHHNTRINVMHCFVVHIPSFTLCGCDKSYRIGIIELHTAYRMKNIMKIINDIYKNRLAKGKAEQLITGCTKIAAI